MSLLALAIEGYFNPPPLVNGKVWYNVEDYQVRYGKPFRFEDGFFKRQNDPRHSSGKQWTF